MTRLPVVKRYKITVTPGKCCCAFNASCATPVQVASQVEEAQSERTYEHAQKLLKNHIRDIIRIPSFLSAEAEVLEIVLADDDVLVSTP